MCCVDVGVVGEWYFFLWVEYVQLVVGIGGLGWEYEGGFGQVCLVCDGLYVGVVQVVGIEYYGQWVVSVGVWGEYIQLQEVVGGYWGEILGLGGVQFNLLLQC